MIPLLPPTARRIYYKAVVGNEHASIRGDLIATICKEAGEAAVCEIADRYITKTPHPSGQATIYEVNAVVMRQQDYEEAITRAYLEGRHDAGRMRFGP